MARAATKTKPSATTVDIRPQVPMYAAFSRLNYKPWFALAELVDNAVQSFLNNEKDLRATDPNYRLRIEIELDDDLVRVTDNAGGISSKELHRAFLPAAAPANDTGLSEFGLGLKAAACWLANRWSVRSSALGEPVERTVTFDVPEIVRTKTEQLEVDERRVDKTAHYTVIDLTELNVSLKNRALGKLRAHLASIYRIFLRDGRLELIVAGEPLQYTEPPLLVAQAYAKPAKVSASSKSIEWRKPFDFKVGKKIRVVGWAGILSKASTTNAGFAIFRRGRLVLGSFGEAYRPEAIFKKANSYIYQRLIGELTVEGVSVSHTKDALQWDEEAVLSALKAELDKAPLPLLKQAENYRVNSAVRGEVAAAPVRGATNARVQHLVPMPASAPLKGEAPTSRATTSKSAQKATHVLAMSYAERNWKVEVQLVHDESRSDWYDLGPDKPTANTVRARLNLAHPFMSNARHSAEALQPLVRLVATLAVAEVVARDGGQARAGLMRRNINTILRTSLVRG